jgi:hypothetical protein
LAGVAESSVVHFKTMLVLFSGDAVAAQLVANKRADKAQVKPAKRVAFIQASLDEQAGEHAIFKIQLASLVDLTYVLIMATYALEGDGPLAFVAYELMELVRKSVTWNAATPEVRNEGLGQPLDNYAVWSHRPEIARAVMAPAKVYLDGQLAKHLGPLKFFENANKLAPWNYELLTPDVLDYFVSVNILSRTERDRIVADNEIAAFRVYSVGSGPIAPTPAEYLLRNSPDALLPESRVWRYWYQNQRRLPGLTLLVKKIASAQPSSGATERCIGIFRKDISAEATSISNDTAQTRIRSHYRAVVDPMARVLLVGLEIYPQ